MPADLYFLERAKVNVEFAFTTDRKRDTVFGVKIYTIFIVAVSFK